MFISTANLQFHMQSSLPIHQQKQFSIQSFLPFPQLKKPTYIKPLSPSMLKHACSNLISPHRNQEVGFKTWRLRTKGFKTYVLFKSRIDQYYPMLRNLYHSDKVFTFTCMSGKLSQII